MRNQWRESNNFGVQSWSPVIVVVVVAVINVVFVVVCVVVVDYVVLK